MKKYLLIFLVVLSFFMIWGIIINEFILNDDIIITKKETINSPSKNQEISKSNSWGEEKTEDKMKELRDKFAIRWLIIEWESYLNNDQYALALKKFLQAFKSTNEDPIIAEQIGDIYMKMNKYMLAYKYYKKIPWELSPEIKDKIIFSYLYNAELKDKWKREDAKKEILSLELDEEKKFYYISSLECLDDFHSCKTNLSNYIFSENKELKIDELKNIKMAFDSYRTYKATAQNTQLEDIYYKDALIVWAFFKNKMFPISVLIWKDILKEKEDYKPILKLIAQSYFELGNMQGSKIYLGLYNKIEKDNKEIIYMLGVINLKLHEYILSNIFLNKALELGYEPKTNVKRRLIYNYFELAQIENMLKEFESLVRNEAVEKEDIYLSIYYHIVYNKKDTALELAKIGLQKFPDDANIYAYMGWIYKDKNELEKASENLKKWLEIDPQNALSNLNMGYLEIAKGEEKKAIVYFKKTIKKDKEGEFGKQALREINRISQK